MSKILRSMFQLQMIIDRLMIFSEKVFNKYMQVIDSNIEFLK